MKHEANLVRIDDLYDSFSWERESPAESRAAARGWEFENDAQGWTLQNGSSPRTRAGQLEFTVGKRGALISPDRLGIPLSSIRAIELRISASKGRHLLLSWSPDDSFRQELRVTADLKPGAEPSVYVVKASSLTGYEALVLNRLRLEPSDDPDAEIALDWIRLVSREGNYDGRPHGLGRDELSDESRHVVFAHAPATFTVGCRVPENGALDLGAGVLNADPGVSFEVTVTKGKETQTVIRHDVAQNERWEDLHADLSRFGGQNVIFKFSVTSARTGAVALWANPMLCARPRREPRLNVIVYLIDTLRADHVGVYGSHNQTTPNLDLLGREGAVFLKCTAQAPWTRPSVTSLLTSLYPREHGVIDHGLRISDGVITLAEQFRRAGYLTAGFTTSTHAGASANLAQGYDEFREPPAILGASAPILDNHAGDYSRASGWALNRSVIPWLERHSDHGFFLYLHSLDPHGPYAPPPPYDSIFASPYQGHIDGSYDKEHGFSNAKTPADIERIKALYDGDIRCNDDAIGELVAALSKLGLLDTTIIVVTADHGEEFREHGGFEHGQSLYEELIHVPFLVRWPSRGEMLQAKRGVRIDQPVELVDVFPTLCDMAKLPIPPDCHGRSLAKSLGLRASSGVSDGRPLDRNAVAWNQSRFGEEVSVSNGRYKLIRRSRLSSLLFDLSSDPGETKDLYGANLDAAAALEATLDRWWLGSRRIVSPLDSGKIVIDQEERQWLEALGYVK